MDLSALTKSIGSYVDEDTLKNLANKAGVNVDSILSGLKSSTLGQTVQNIANVVPGSVQTGIKGLVSSGIKNITSGGNTATSSSPTTSKGFSGRSLVKIIADGQVSPELLPKTAELKALEQAVANSGNSNETKVRWQIGVIEIAVIIAVIILIIIVAKKFS